MLRLNKRKHSLKSSTIPRAYAGAQSFSTSDGYSSPDIHINMLVPAQYPFWRTETFDTFVINHLDFALDTTIAPLTLPILPPASPNLAELSFRQKLLEGAKKDMKEDRSKRSIAFNLLFNCIPIHFRSSWTKGILNSADLWKKIEEMCNYRVDYQLKIFFRKQFDELKLATCKILSVTNYENLLNQILQDHERCGGVITMDDRVAKIRGDLKNFQSISN